MKHAAPLDLMEKLIWDKSVSGTVIDVGKPISSEDTGSLQVTIRLHIDYLDRRSALLAMFRAPGEDSVGSNDSVLKVKFLRVGKRPLSRGHDHGQHPLLDWHLR